MPRANTSPEQTGEELPGVASYRTRRSTSEIYDIEECRLLHKTSALGHLSEYKSQDDVKAISVLQIAYYPTLLTTRQILLEQDGYVVTSALGNDEGMALALSTHFDIIVVGFSAGNRSRTKMVRWLKLNLPATPIVVLLAYPSESFPDADCATLSENPRQWLAAVRQTCAKEPI